MRDPILNSFNRQTFHVSHCLVTSFAVTHNTREFQDFGDPPTVVFPIQVNREIHASMISKSLGTKGRPGPALRQD